MNDSTNPDKLPRRQWLTPVIQRYGFLPCGWFSLAGLALLVVLLAMLGEPARILLRYQRDALLDQHEYWRLLTGHLVHGSWQHAWLNLAGLASIVALFRGLYSPMQWLCIAVVSGIGIDLGLVLLMPQLQWYVGLSGVLHGLLAAGALRWWHVEHWLLAAALSLMLVGKLIWEQWQGALPLSGDLNVIVNAHLYGAGSGLLAGACIWLYARTPQAENNNLK